MTLSEKKTTTTSSAGVSDMRARKILALPVACVALASTFAAGSASADESHADYNTSGSCSSHETFIVPGGGQTTTKPVDKVASAQVSSIERALDSAGQSHTTVTYDAVPFLNETYGVSETEGAKRVLGIIKDFAERCSDTSISMTGYSEGAGIVSRIAREIGAGRGPVESEKLGSVVAFSSPYADSDGTQHYGTADDAPGIVGRMPDGYGSVSGKILDVCDAGDVVCDADVYKRLSNVSQDIRGSFKAVGAEDVAEGWRESARVLIDEVSSDGVAESIDNAVSGSRGTAKHASLYTSGKSFDVGMRFLAAGAD